MLIETKYLGEMEIDEKKMIAFESGLPGFHEEKEFVIIDIPKNEHLQLLQSVQTPDVAFFVTNPHYFYEDYEFRLDEHIIDSLQIKGEKEIVILSIMTIKDPFSTSTINLQAPIVINSVKKCGKQCILNDGRYTMREKVSLPTKESRA